MPDRLIYADNAATTCVSQSVLNAMLPYFTENYGNPSSIYKPGRNAGRAVLAARERIAGVLGCTEREIYFTSGGSESDNWAIKSAAEAMSANGKRHIVTSAFEHHAVLNTCRYLEKHGFEVTYLPVGEKGIIDPKQAAEAVRSDTALVTVMLANNEIGTIQPVAQIAKICRERGVLIHTDAVQAIGNIPVDLKELGVDMLSASGHKIHAQKGIGFLYVRSGVDLPQFIHGGAQERGMRAGTENVPAIAGLAQAVEDSCADISGRSERTARLRNRITDGILSGVPASRLNGDKTRRLCGNINISFLGVEGESLLLLLDMNGICASSGSACTSGSPDPSHVLLSLGLPQEIAHGSLRLSIDESLTDEDADYIIETVKSSVARIRAMSPLWEDITKGRRTAQGLLDFVSPAVRQ